MKENVIPCACTILRKVSRATSRCYEEQLSYANVSATQFAILRALQRNGATALSPLAKQLVLERTSLYRSISPLAAKKFITLKQSRFNKRIKEACLTKKGEKVIEEGLPYWEKAQEKFLQTVGKEQWQELSSKLETILTLLEKGK